MNEKMITLENLTFSYDNKKVFDNLNITINQGDFIGIVGPNGSGKSTLLKLILKQLTPNKGKVNYEKDFSIGYVEQFGLNQHISFPASVYEIVMLGLYEEIGFFKRLKKEHKEMINQALETVGIKELAHKQIHALSGGQQQKVLIAKAIVANPCLIVFDEATSALDEKSEKDLLDLLCKINCEYKTTIIMVSHHFDNKEYLTRMFNLHDGQVIDERKGK